ncbi:MAG: hypothetical protein N2662_00960 [Bacteroidales bacterium]|nr:hypothetical protein [Bacteroidales bacterium]
MKLQNYNRVVRQMLKMILSPVLGWDDILSQPSRTIGWHLKHFVFPVVGLVIASHLVGYMVLAITVGNYSIAYVLVKVVASFFDSFFTFYISTLLVYEWTKKLNWSVSYDQLFILNCYSLSAFWTGKILAGLLANYPTLGSFFVFLGISGIYPFILGAERTRLIEPARLTKLIAMNASVVILIYLIIQWVFDFPLKSLYYLHVFNR